MAHLRRQRLDGELDPAAEPVGGVGPQPEIDAEPVRMGEMVQGDERVEPSLGAGARRSVRSGPGRPGPPGPRSRTTRAHSMLNRKLLQPRAAARSSASSGRSKNPTALPDGSTRPTCSQASQLLAGSPGPLKPPSTWKPAVATPNRKSSGSGPASSSLVRGGLVDGTGPTSRSSVRPPVAARRATDPRRRAPTCPGARSPGRGRAPGGHRVAMVACGRPGTSRAGPPLP